jgi:hypothetical protein
MRYRRLLALVGAIVVLGAVPRVMTQQTGARAARIGQNAFEESVRIRLADRQSKCMNAIGSADFCSCLGTSLPLEVDFQRYIAVTTSVATVSQLSAEENGLAARIIATRDACVAKVFAASKGPI